MPGKYAIYSRKSKFTGKGESIENQIELCREYIQKIYGEVALDNIIIYEDEGFSGKNTERPRFQKMLQDAYKKKFSAVICYRLDRISRNIGDFAKLIEEMNTLNISFISIKEQFDTSSPIGRAMMYIASVFSQLERETIAERIRDNMHELAKTGRWLGGTTPTGYTSECIQNVTIDGKLKKSCKLKLLPDEAGLIQIIFHKFLETSSLSKTETYLLQNGYVSKNNKYLSRFAIRSIITNPVYLQADMDAYRYFIENNAELYSTLEDFDGIHGIMAYNRTDQTNGKATRTRDIEEWIISVGKHRGIIAGDVWIRIQKILGDNKQKTINKPKSNIALLSGLLLCKCGEAMRPKAFHVTADGSKRFYYLCSMKEKSRGQICNNKNPNGDMLDKAVCEEINKLSYNKFELYTQLEQAKKKMSEEKNIYNEYDSFIKQINENEKEINQLISTYAKSSGTVSEEYLLRQIEEKHRNKEELRKQIHNRKYAVTMGKLENNEFELNKISTSILQNGINNFNLEQKRAALRTVIKKIVWDGSNINIYLEGSD
ncbi:MAG: recombinase family protein [Herbinix sp.]|nr:recombinase family protein [Herbinix sp.]